MKGSQAGLYSGIRSIRKKSSLWLTENASVHVIPAISPQLLAISEFTSINLIVCNISRNCSAWSVRLLGFFFVKFKSVEIIFFIPSKKILTDCLTAFQKRKLYAPKWSYESVNPKELMNYDSPSYAAMIDSITFFFSRLRGTGVISKSWALSKYFPVGSLCTLKILVQKIE